ncbi:drug/metabolite transporter (DMT)-like permease [Clostridium punense]|uniref:Drug/metabolite transporter (DMT)-like permease n=1 Tax=Clostridium punense TaxID=1054297 RepID=A0ABS4JZ46_9CLOT|nr:DMT family transporter [Clostridium punense]MBP2020798.1 drug/metabolite transporter (DMT)-like permease [Clostridium punense]
MEKLFKRSSLFADISLLLVAIIWGGGFIAVKDSLDVLTPYYQMALRFSISTLLMYIVFYNKVKKINKNQFKHGAIIGVFLFLGFAFQTVGIKYTTAGKSAFLTAVYVVLVPFLQWIIIKRKPDNYSIAGAVICLLGISFLTLQGGFSLNYGDGLTLICAFAFAGQILAIGKYVELDDPLILTIVQLGVAAVLSLIVALFFEPIPTHMNLRAISSILYLAVFSTTLAFLVQNIAQKYTSSTHAAIILSLESFFGAVFSVFFFNEIFNIAMIVGCILIFIAIITTETKLEFLKKRANNADSNENIM